MLPDGPSTRKEGIHARPLLPSDPASVTASGPTRWGLGSPTYIAYLDARGHPRSTIRRIRPRRRALRRLARLRAHRPRGRDPGDHPTRSSTIICPTAAAPPRPRPTRDQVRAALAHLLRLPGGPLQRPRPASPPTPVEAFLELYRGHLRDTLRPGRVDVLLSTPLRPGIPPGQVRRRPRELGDPPPRGPDDLHRGIRRPLSPRLGPGGGQLPAEPPAIPPAPRPLQPGLGRGRPPYPPLADWITSRARCPTTSSAGSWAASIGRPRPAAATTPWPSARSTSACGSAR